MAMVPGLGAAGIPGSLSNKARVERAIESVLNQLDPIGTELIVVDEGLPDGTTEAIEEIFSLALSTGKLKIARMEKDRGDRGAARNFGAEHASGVYLTFLDPEDRWLPGRLERLAPWLSRHDFILSAPESPTEGSDPSGIDTDWLRAFVSHNWAMPSSTVIHRSLFNAVGGFASGYQKFPLPSKIPGQLDYEFWLKALLELNHANRRERFALLGRGRLDLEIDEQKTKPQGFAGKLVQLREAVTLIHLARKLPWRSWPEILGQVKTRIT
jgi:glycosyltransferase involved in cell wall biosynthesis